MFEDARQSRILEYQSGVRISKAKIVRTIPDAPVTKVEKWLAIVFIAVAVLTMLAAAFAMFLFAGMS